MPRGVPNTDNSQGLVFFGAVDRRGRTENGQIASALPAWYFDEAIDELKESVASTERSLERGTIPADSIPTARARLARDKQRLNEIESTRPKPNHKQLIWLRQKQKELESEISSSMFSKEEMRTGDASPHEELRRAKSPNIKIDHELARLIGLKPKQGKVSRDDAIRALKPINKLLGDPTDAEYLRKDFRTYRTQRVTPFVGQEPDRFAPEPPPDEEAEATNGRETPTTRIERSA